MKHPLPRARLQKLRPQLLRAGVQLFFFLTMPGAFVVGFSGVKSLFRHIGAGEVLQADSFTCTLLGLCGFTILFGRFFCGSVCAFGSLGDLVYGISGWVQKKLFHRKKPVALPERAIRLGQWGKYLLLAVLVVLCTAGQDSALSGASPWVVFSRLTALRLPGSAHLAGAVLLGILLLGMALHPRFFCQCLCPMGAVFALLPTLPPAQLHRDADACIPGCNACARQCPVSLRPAEEGPRSGECICCEKCQNICPKHNLSRWDSRLFSNTWMPLLGKAVLFFLMGLCLGLC